MQYTESEIINELIQNGKKVEDYLVILSEDGESDMLYFIYKNILFFVMMANDSLYFQCLEYIKMHGAVYSSKDEFKQKHPEIICR